MPPKDSKAKGKVNATQKQKIIEDKTFGLKNKNKSKAVQNYIRSVQAQVLGTRTKTEHELKAEQKLKVEQKRISKQSKLAQSLLKAQQALNTLQTNTEGSLNNKIITEQQKINLYVDLRELKKVGDKYIPYDDKNIDDDEDRFRPQTDIICKYFLEAVQKQLYGWFWNCPNGEKCQYRHALPEGYVLNIDEPEEILENEKTIEDIIDEQRAKLTGTGTRLTLDVFTKWVENRKKINDVGEKNNNSKTKKNNPLTGKAIFEHNPKSYNTESYGADEDQEIDDIINMSRTEKKKNEALFIGEMNNLTTNNENIDTIPVDISLFTDPVDEVVFTE